MNTTNLHIPSNKVRDIERYFITELRDIYAEGEIRMFVRMLFEAYLGWSQTELLLRREETVNQSDLLRFHWAVEDLKRHRPIQHIIGWTELCGCRIEVTKDTLIPRPETEEIVNWTINHFSRFKNQDSKIKVLDLCTGSGCIAIALAKHLPQAQVTAVDISEKALDVAKRNAETNNVAVDFLQADILSPFTIHNSQFTLIISNPPYVMDKERAVMQPNVLDWEPAQALFVPDSDPLLFYRAIARHAAKTLKPRGTLYFEINPLYINEMQQMLSEEGFSHTEIRNDQFGKQRFTKSWQ